MKTVAILCGRYLPGYKDGGPVRTLVNLTECLGNRYRFRIITNDRDHGDKQAYPNIVYGKPNRVGMANVFYLKPKGFSFRTIKKLIGNVDIVYVCGPYNNYAYKTMILKRIGVLKKPVIVASMGSFSEGAIAIKNKKKKFFIAICKVLGLYKKITWSVTSELEEQDVKRVIGKNSICVIAEDLPRKINRVKIKKDRTIFKVVFISRISEMKNLLYAIRVLQKVKKNIMFDIYGPIEDVEYWKRCKQELENLPDNIIWEYKGMADSTEIVRVFSGYDVFLFPTKGENYGHVIFEALAGGCIPIISDQTPWLDLERTECGKIIPLSDENEYIKSVEIFADMCPTEIEKMKKKANEYALAKYDESIKNTGYVKIFG